MVSSVLFGGLFLAVCGLGLVSDYYEKSGEWKKRSNAMLTMSATLFLMGIVGACIIFTL